MRALQSVGVREKKGTRRRRPSLDTLPHGGFGLYFAGRHYGAFIGCRLDRFSCSPLLLLGLDIQIRITLNFSSSCIHSGFRLVIPHPIHVVLGIKPRVLYMVDKILYPLAYISSLELKLFNQKCRVSELSVGITQRLARVKGF